MSHFTVLVVGDNHEDQLQPYHEFECTGTNDEYVVDVDITDDARRKYETSTTRRFVDPDGNQHDPYSEWFYRDPTDKESEKIGPLAGTGAGGGLSWTSRDWGDGRGYRTKVHSIPEGWTETEIDTKDIQSLSDFCKYWYGSDVVDDEAKVDRDGDHKFGYILTDSGGDVVKVVDRTNPNKKWDWYSVGGRWTGFWKDKSGRKVDVIRKGDIDLDGMRAEAEKQANDDFDLLASVCDPFKDQPFTPWSEVRDLDDARDVYNKQPIVKAVRASKELQHGFGIDADTYREGRDKYVSEKVNAVGTTLAVVKDGEWYERGSMGWWGIVSDEKDRDEWNAEFHKLIDDLPDDALLTVVDCHI